MIIEKITDEELLRLTDDDITKLIKIECNMQGLEYPEYPEYFDNVPYVDYVEHDVYYISGLHCRNIHFKTEESAQGFLDLLNNSSDIIYAESYGYKYVYDPLAKPKFGQVISCKIITIESYRLVRSAKDENRIINSKNETIRDEYYKKLKLIEHIEMPVWDRLQTIKQSKKTNN